MLVMVQALGGSPMLHKSVISFYSGTNKNLTLGIPGCFPVGSQTKGWFPLPFPCRFCICGRMFMTFPPGSGCVRCNVLFGFKATLSYLKEIRLQLGTMVALKTIFAYLHGAVQTMLVDRVVSWSRRETLLPQWHLAAYSSQRLFLARTSILKCR